VSPLEVVAAVITLFFGFGIAMGVLIVVALPVFRRYREERRRMHSNRRRYMDGGWQEPPSLDDDDTKPPRWPAG
jgi:hypothetical protein